MFIRHKYVNICLNVCIYIYIYIHMILEGYNNDITNKEY